MANLNITKTGPEAQIDSVWHDEDYEAARFRALDVTPRPARAWQETAAMAAMSLMMSGVFFLAAWYAETRPFPELAWVTFWRVLMIVFALIPLLLIALDAITRWRERNAYVARARIARDRLMNPVTADLIAGMTPEQYIRVLEAMAALERDTAPHRIYRGIESLSVSAPTPRDETRKATEAALAAPVDPPGVWLEDILNEAHLILAGRSGSGKSASAEALLATAIDRGDAVMVIDPHWHPGKWHNVEAVGGGRDYDAIRAVLRALEDEMTRRYAALARGEDVGAQALVIIDEAPAILGELGDDWKRFSKRLGSEARKIGIRMALLTQSPLVEDIGMNSAMRRNFTIIGLDLASIRLMLRDEPDPVVRRAILDKLEGERFPALYERLGQFRILDRRGIHLIRPSRAPNVWRLSVCTSPHASGPQARQTDRQTDATIERLKEFIRQGLTRDAARAAGVEFDNADWTRARREVEADDYLRDLLERDPGGAA